MTVVCAGWDESRAVDGHIPGVHDDRRRIGRPGPGLHWAGRLLQGLGNCCWKRQSRVVRVRSFALFGYSNDNVDGQHLLLSVRRSFQLRAPCVGAEFTGSPGSLVDENYGLQYLQTLVRTQIESTFCLWDFIYLSCLKITATVHLM